MKNLLTILALSVLFTNAAQARPELTSQCKTSIQRAANAAKKFHAKYPGAVKKTLQSAAQYCDANRDKCELLADKAVEVCVEKGCLEKVEQVIRNCFE